MDKNYIIFESEGGRGTPCSGLLRHHLPRGEGGKGESRNGKGDGEGGRGPPNA